MPESFPMFNDPVADFLGEWSSGINIYSVVFRISLAVILAAVVGCERSSKRHSAGLRTFILVSIASAVSAVNVPASVILQDSGRLY